MMKLVLLLTALVITTSANPVLEEKAREALDLIHKLKSPEYWEGLQSHADVNNVLKKLESAGFVDERKSAALRKASSTLSEVMKSVLSLLKATWTEGGKPTDEDLTKWAKQLSKALRESHYNSRKYAYEGKILPITNETVDVLKRVVVQNPMKESGNTFLESLKEQLPDLYVVGNRIRKVHNFIIKQIKNDEPIFEKMPRRTEEEDVVVTEFLAQFFFDEFLTILQSEENAIVFFKSWAVFFDTLRDPASYESLEALLKGFARSKRLESRGILIREIRKCAGSYVSDASKAKYHASIKIYLKVFKAILADGQNTVPHDLVEIMHEVKSVAEPALSSILEEFALSLNMHGVMPFRKCLVKAEDRQLYKEILAINEPILSENKLSEIKQKNEKVYALVYLVNSLVRAERRRQGLGAEADGYFKELFTTKHALLRLAEYMKPSEETTAMIKAAVKEMVAKHNALSADAKKELVGMFPYRTVIGHSLLP